MALGYCRLTRAEFFGMTPKEFNIRMRAETERENRAFERIAQHACWIVNMVLGPKRPLTVRKLLHSKKDAQEREE